MFRPSADWFFESAADSFGDRHIVIILSGMLSEGVIDANREPIDQFSAEPSRGRA